MKNRMRVLLVFVFATMLLGTFVATAQAEDVSPPSWRGQPYSTMQEWNFKTNGNNGYGIYYPPDGSWSNSYGTPGASIHVGPGGSATYYKPMGPDPGGAWELESIWQEPVPEYTAIGLDIPNSPYDPPDSYKLLRLQVTYNSSYDDPIVLGLDGWALQSESTEDLGDGWAVLIQDWRYEPNPPAEVFGVADDFGGGTTMVSEIVVDTICVPEPATLAVLLIGAFLGLSRRRR